MRQPQARMAAPDLAISHLEFRVADAAAMEAFYTEALGFVVTDRGHGPGAMVFLSRSAREHHQIVLNPVTDGAGAPDRLDHVAFRVGSLDALRGVHRRLAGAGADALESVSHGTTWSVYFRDPEANRIEVFTETPWHVDQPARFEIDLGLPDEALIAATEAAIRDQPGFRPVADWRAGHRREMAAGGG